jgi:hypothetical protein
MLWLATVRHVLWLGVHLLLLVTLGLSFVLPLVDHHAAERDPWHDHIILGGTHAQQVAALHDHTHGYEHSHSHAADSAALISSTNAAQVLAMTSRDGHSPLAIGFMGKAVAVPAALYVPNRLSLEEVAWPESLVIAGLTARVPAPPPRLFSLDV